MGQKEKKAYLEAIRARYIQANRIGKKRILDEFCAVCGYNRKYAIYLLSKPRKRHKAKPGRKSKYTEKPFLNALTRIWKASDFMCSRRFKTVIPLWLRLPLFQPLQQSPCTTIHHSHAGGRPPVGSATASPQPPTLSSSPRWQSGHPARCIRLRRPHPPGSPHPAASEVLVADPPPGGVRS